MLFLLTEQFGATIRSFSRILAIIMIRSILKVVPQLILSPVTILLVRRTRAYEESLPQRAEG